MRAVSSDRADPSQKLAVCIGCGCDDLHVCVREISIEVKGRFVPLAQGPSVCHWLRLDRAAGLGVCSACPGSVERWDAGDRDGPACVISP